MSPGRCGYTWPEDLDVAHSPTFDGFPVDHRVRAVVDDAVPAVHRWETDPTLHDY